MPKYLIEESTLKGLADAIRTVSGTDRSYTPSEMINAVTTILETGTYILTDEGGNEVPAVFVEQETRFTATANDIRIGTTAVTESGVTTGTKEIPSYHTYDGYRMITKGGLLAVPHANYDYTKFQAIVCAYNTNAADSVAATMVAINDNVYEVGSTESLSIIIKDDTVRRVSFGINNDSGGICFIRYIMYKEVY